VTTDEMELVQLTEAVVPEAETFSPVGAAGAVSTEVSRLGWEHPATLHAFTKKENDLPLVRRDAAYEGDVTVATFVPSRQTS
jgi:hypothetical protein